MPPTIVLVHGAFADSGSWDRVIDLLPAEHRVIAAANPLRSLAADAESVSDLVRTIDGPVLLVAHSYGGAVISNVAADAGEITGLVYVNGFARSHRRWRPSRRMATQAVAGSRGTLARWPGRSIRRGLSRSM